MKVLAQFALALGMLLGIGAAAAIFGLSERTSIDTRSGRMRHQTLCWSVVVASNIEAPFPIISTEAGSRATPEWSLVGEHWNNVLGAGCDCGRGGRIMCLFNDVEGFLRVSAPEEEKRIAGSFLMWIRSSKDPYSTYTEWKDDDAFEIRNSSHEVLWSSDQDE